jgi:hypothetical protein
MYHVPCTHLAGHERASGGYQSDTDPFSCSLNGPAFEDPRHALIRAVKEPELVAALSLRAKRAGLRKQPRMAGEMVLASVE